MSVVVRLQLQAWGGWEASSSQSQRIVPRAPCSSSSQGNGVELSLLALAGGRWLEGAAGGRLSQQTAFCYCWGPPASLQLTPEEDSEHSRTCLPHPEVSQVVLELWLDQKWQLCLHSGTRGRRPGRGFVGHRGRCEFSGCALSIIALLQKTTPAGVRGLLPALAPAGPEGCGAVWGVGFRVQG